MLGEDSRNLVVAIIAALDEEEGIEPTIEDLRQYLKNPKIIVVDGKSRDRTAEIARDLGAEVIVQNGKGKGDAIAQALEKIDADSEYVILTDADYTYPAEYVPAMVRILERDPSVGIVCGNRFNSHFELRSMHNMFYFGNRLLAFTHNVLNGVAMHDPLTGLRVVRARVLQGWTPRSKGFDIEVELNHHVERRGFNIVEIPIYYRPRVGQKKLKLRHGTSILKRMMLETLY